MNYDLGYPASHPMHRYDPKPRFYRRDRVRWPEIPNALPDIPPDRLLALPSRDDVVMVHERNRNVRRGDRARAPVRAGRGPGDGRPR